MLIPLRDIRDNDGKRVGGKAGNLSFLLNSGIEVPDGVCIPSGVYRRFVDETGLTIKIFTELNRKDFSAMRWEEMWDASLKIRKLFLHASFPDAMEKELAEGVAPFASNLAVSVRSSAPVEDSEQSSYAGLFESFIHINCIESILHHVKLVWASLWSDRALLYQKELGLDPRSSSMAVVIQEMVYGDVSGIAFTENPIQAGESVIEAVYGLNQALVDGSVEPDRWILDRKSGRVRDFTESTRENKLVALSSQAGMVPCTEEERSRPPLDKTSLKTVYENSRRIEELYRRPQDVEWTICNGQLVTLQARPVTAGSGADDESKRLWYRSLRRSFHNLMELLDRIENRVLPEMDHESGEMENMDLALLSDRKLADEIERRRERLNYWNSVYYDECIPLAHGPRLFGEVYNNRVSPEDPFEFVNLLAATNMKSLTRNGMLVSMAKELQESPALREELEAGTIPAGGFGNTVNEFLAEYGALITGSTEREKQREILAPLLLNWSGSENLSTAGAAAAVDLEAAFMESFPGDDRETAEELLSLARASYRLRDDDNIYIGKIESEYRRSVDQGARRLENRGAETDGLDDKHIVSLLRGKRPHSRPERPGPEETPAPYRARQLTGQAASKGIASGIARVIQDTGDLYRFQPGEILVCDAVDPVMTFVLPVCAGIVERRGGMLIHGAIIAREYQVPCVTGIPDAASLIKTGDRVTVDGFLGIVTIG